MGRTWPRARGNKSHSSIQAQISQQLSLEGSAYSFPRKILCDSLMLSCTARCQLQNHEFEAVLGDCYCIRHSDSTFWNKKKENLKDQSSPLTSEVSRLGK